MRHTTRTEWSLYRIKSVRGIDNFVYRKDCFIVYDECIPFGGKPMKNLLLIATLFISFSSTAYADVGCGPSPRPDIEKVPDTADDTGEEAQDSGEEANGLPSRFVLLSCLLLFLDWLFLPEEENKSKIYLCTKPSFKSQSMVFCAF